MSKILEEWMEIYGIIKTPLGNYEMLSEFPTNVGIPFSLRERGMMSVLVINGNGFAVTIYPLLANCIIERFPEKLFRLVKYSIDELEEENIKVESQDVTPE